MQRPFEVVRVLDMPCHLRGARPQERLHLIEQGGVDEWFVRARIQGTLRTGSGAFEEELAGVDIEPGALGERVVDRTPAEFAGYLVGHAAEPDVAAGLHSHRPETFEVKGCAPGERIVQQC